MKTQATRYTRLELFYLNYWEARGHRHQPGERPRMTIKHPCREIGYGVICAVLAIGMVGIWLHAAAVQ